MRRLLVLPALAAALLAAAPPGGITVRNAWSRATAPGADVAVIYLTIEEAGAPDRLLGASTDVAADASLHRTITEGGTATMRPVGAAPVTAASPLRLAPGGLHLMLTGLRHPLVAGASVALTLRFARAGEVRVAVPVRALGATPGDGMAGMRMR